MLLYAKVLVEGNLGGGTMVTVEPIRDPQKLAEIKRRLKRRDPRYFCFFTLGLNTALRPGDLLRLKAGDLMTDPAR